MADDSSDMQTKMPRGGRVTAEIHIKLYSCTHNSTVHVRHRHPGATLSKAEPGNTQFQQLHGKKYEPNICYGEQITGNVG